MTAATDQLVQLPSTLWVPPRVGSYGDEVLDWSAQHGFTLDPEQKRDVDALVSYGPGGKWLTLESCVIEGRQNGKTTNELLPVAMADAWGLFGGPPDRVVWTAHLMATTLDVFKTVTRLIDTYETLSSRVKAIRQSKSERAVELMDGSEFLFAARTAGGGRGIGGKRIVFDEAFALMAGPLGALVPILSARPDPQINYGSSAGKGESVALRKLQRRGRARNDPALILIEYRARGSWSKPGCDLGTNCTHTYGTAGCQLDDEDSWRSANHAIARERITLAFVRNERRTLPPLEFGRERLGWEEEGDDADRPISPEDWAATAVPADQPVPDGVPVFFLDVAPNGRSASIGLAIDQRPATGVDDGERRQLVPHAELAAHRIGVDWFVDRAKELKTRYPRALFAGSATGGIGALLPALAAAGLAVHVAGTDKGRPRPHRAGTIRLYSDAEMARACVHTAQLVAGPDHGMTHTDDPLLTTAVEGTTSRDLGDGLWLLTRRGEQTVDLSPLYAEVGALWLLETSRSSRYPVARSIY